MYIPRYCNLPVATAARQETEDLGIFSMYIGIYKCTRIIAKMMCSSETVSF